MKEGGQLRVGLSGPRLEAQGVLQVCADLCVAVLESMPACITPETLTLQV